MRCVSVSTKFSIVHCPVQLLDDEWGEVFNADVEVASSIWDVQSVTHTTDSLGTRGAYVKLVLALCSIFVVLFGIVPAPLVAA